MQGRITDIHPDDAFEDKKHDIIDLEGELTDVLPSPAGYNWFRAEFAPNNGNTPYYFYAIQFVALPLAEE